MNPTEKDEALAMFTEALAIFLDIYKGDPYVDQRVNNLNREELLRLINGMIYVNGQLVDSIVQGSGGYYTEADVIQRLAQAVVEADPDA